MVLYKKKQNKIVNVTSSHHKSTIIEDGPKKKPETILYCYRTKEEFDCIDERIETYSIKYMTKRWHGTVWCNIFDMAYYNSFVLYNEAYTDYNIGKSCKRYLYMIDLGNDICQNHKKVKFRPVRFVAVEKSDKKTDFFIGPD